MAGEQHGHAGVARTADEHLAHDVDADGVEPAERLVEDEGDRVVDERGGELDALLVAERELLHAVVGPVGDADLLHPVARGAGVPVLFSSHQLELVERLCDAVAIIKDGTLVASGTVDELRSRGPRDLWRVEVHDAAPGWTDAIPGADVQSRNGVLTVVRMQDEQRLLDAARAAGRLTRFEPVAPTLAELFREAIA